ncbi:glycine-rich cell wall structural protein [Gracilaria domingensis]|nr:glycine-rich cell wall structural protein [Gracilaria domingensis]
MTRAPRWRIVSARTSSSGCRAWHTNSVRPSRQPRRRRRRAAHAAPPTDHLCSTCATNTPPTVRFERGQFGFYIDPARYAVKQRQVGPLGRGRRRKVVAGVDKDGNIITAWIGVDSRAKGARTQGGEMVTIPDEYAEGALGGGGGGGGGGYGPGGGGGGYGPGGGGGGFGPGGGGGGGPGGGGPGGGGPGGGAGPGGGGAGNAPGAAGAVAAAAAARKNQAANGPTPRAPGAPTARSAGYAAGAQGADGTGSGQGE